MVSSDKGLVEDWSLFQQSLQAIQVIGDALMQLENYNIMSIRNIREVGRKLGYYSSATDCSVNPFHAYDDVLLSPSAKRELQQLVKSLQDGKTNFFLIFHFYYRNFLL